MKNLLKAIEILDQSTSLRELQSVYMRARDFKDTVVNAHLTRRAEQIGAEADFLMAASEYFDKSSEQEDEEDW